MLNEIFYEMFKQMPRQGPGKAEYTKKALSFCVIPDSPQILDIGCGTGAQTLSLAENTDGLIMAVDNYGPFLEQLKKKVKKSGFFEKIQIIQCDMNQLSIKQKFDLIWCEGAIFVIGFDKGLREFKKLLKPGGFMAVTEVAWTKENPPQEAVAYWEKEYPAITDVSSNINIIRSAGYELVRHFIMPRDAWDEFYAALKSITIRMQEKYKKNKEAEKIIDYAVKEIEAYEKFSEFYGYVFFIMKNKK
jgi:ubiquinone/menaquinone biosynthesis C-methylase UbiE